MEERSEFAAPLFRPDSWESLEQRWRRNKSMLLYALNGGNVIAFLGSGVSAAYGYPSWVGFASEMLEKTLDKLQHVKPSPPQEKDIQPFREILGLDLGDEERGKIEKSLNANTLTFLIGACRLALGGSKGLENAYKEIIDGIFARPKSSPKGDPLSALLKLPIRRFVTSNYDCELERALAKRGLASADDLGLDSSTLLGLGEKACSCRSSFAQGLDGIDRIARFALADVPERTAQVFHCHGRYDQPKSVIATEDDYRTWYMSRQDDTYLAFQQNIELLFGSNPLLFIGYGLGDEDLLRPLRQFIAANPASKGERPLFALLAYSSPEEHYRLAALSERFGLNVCPFEWGGPGKEDLTSALCSELEGIGGQLKEACRSSREKPKMRRAVVFERPPEPHCEIECISRLPVPSFPALQEAVRQPGVVVLVGPSGCGKSHHLLGLVNSASQEGFRGAFYWNAHYANEAVTAIDTALHYLDPVGEHSGTRYDRIGLGLQSHRFLLVIDGCERLLRRNGVPGDGTSYSAVFRRLLHVIADPRSQSTVVVAGRLRPADLDDIQAHERIRVLRASRIPARDLREHSPFACLRKEMDDRLSALCSLLRGHAYGLHLAGKYRELRISAPSGDPLDELIRELSEDLRDERLHAMVRLLIKAMENDPERGGGLVESFLKRLGLFLSPICEGTLELCARQAFADCQKDWQAGAYQSLYGWLIEMGLLIPLAQSNRPKSLGYSVHITVRTALFSPREGLAVDPLPAFGLSGFTSGRQGVDPALEYRSQVESLFKEIVAKADGLLANGEPRDGETARCEESARDLCRDAFNLIRTRMEANTAPRWCTYEEYVQYGLRVADLARRTMPNEVWTYCEHPDAWTFAEADESPLYPAELAWLYNDLALAYSAGGQVREACALWEKTYEISRLIEDPETGGGYHLEVLLSLTMTSIERGRLAAAAQYADDAERILKGLPDRDYKARILGLRGLMAHLQGNLQRAEDLYEKALKYLRKANNLRAQSLFLKHLADIKIVTERYDKADLLIRNSRALAESGVFPELVACARISEGHRLMRLGNPVQARLEYTAVLNEARRIGFHKLEVGALTALARLALGQKDAEGARSLALQASNLANELGLGLRQTHSLVVLGLATLETGQTDLGVAYLRLAKRMADRQEYWSRSREAEDKLRELGVGPEEPAP